ncbi:MAG: hypothetical protein L0312_06225 [Acidobacteria bacterium]|nr:hypothetical protein [Acidobacteriota bacterium]
MTMNLFDSLDDGELRQEQRGPGATVLRQFAVPEETALLSALEDVIARAPFRHMITHDVGVSAWTKSHLQSAEHLGSEGKQRTSVRRK